MYNDIEDASGRPVKRLSLWVILADLFGVALLISLIFAAAGAPAMKQVILLLLLLVPVAGLVISLRARK